MAYDASIKNDHQPILNIYLGFSELEFIINNGILILTEESFYNKGLVTASCETFIGLPSIENIIKIINLFLKEGRGRYASNPSIRELLSIIEDRHINGCCHCC